MTLTKLTRFNYKICNVSYMVHICLQGNNIVFLANVGNTSCISVLAPLSNGVLSGTLEPVYYFDKDNFLSSNKRKAKVTVEHGKNGAMLYTIKNSLFLV